MLAIAGAVRRSSQIAAWICCHRSCPATSPWWRSLSCALQRHRLRPQPVQPDHRHARSPARRAVFPVRAWVGPPRHNGLIAICGVDAGRANRRRVSRMNFPPSAPARIEPQEARHSGSARRRRRCRDAPSARGSAPMRRPAPAAATPVAPASSWPLCRRPGRRRLRGPAVIRGAHRQQQERDVVPTEIDRQLQRRHAEDVVPVQVGAAADRVARGSDVAAVDRVEQRVGGLHVHGGAVGGRGAAGRRGTRQGRRRRRPSPPRSPTAPAAAPGWRDAAAHGRA